MGVLCLLIGSVFLAGSFSSPNVSFGLIFFQYKFDLAGKLFINPGQPFGHVFMDCTFTYAEHLCSLPDCVRSSQNVLGYFNCPFSYIILQFPPSPEPINNLYSIREGFKTINS